jgi:primosomal protein N' (replication factor Y)
MIAEVDDQPRIVVATPGAEPVARSGYRAVVALDATTGAISLLAQESLTRRLFGAAVLGAPDADIVIVAPSEDRAVQAVSRWDSPWAARRELVERGEAHLPPVYRAFRLDGSRQDIEAVTEQVLATPSLRVLGPVDSADPPKSHAFLIVERSQGGLLAQRLAEITRVRSADSKSHHVQVRVDPRDF